MIKCLEKALEFVPNNNAFPEEKDLPETYRILRTTERAYEELLSTGSQVHAQLRERRYQIAELICNVLKVDVENLYGFIKDREVDEATIIDFFSCLQANTYIPRLREVLRRIVPNIEQAIEKGAKKTEELFPEKISFEL